jgi:hypothetical protein
MFNNQNNFKSCWNYIICEKIWKDALR